MNMLYGTAWVWRSMAGLEPAARLGKSPAQIVYKWAMDLGMLPLTGTTQPEHMREVLKTHELTLTADEIRGIEAIS